MTTSGAWHRYSSRVRLVPAPNYVDQSSNEYNSDPIEASAIAAIIGKDRTPESPVFIGSVKSNFGSVPLILAIDTSF
jgi:hypothetical protein